MLKKPTLSDRFSIPWRKNTNHCILQQNNIIFEIKCKSKNPNTRHSEFLQTEIMKWMQVAFKKKIKISKSNANQKRIMKIRFCYGLQTRKDLQLFFIYFQTVFNQKFYIKQATFPTLSLDCSVQDDFIILAELL